MSLPTSASLDRRRFLTLSGAALGAATLSGCATSVDDGSGGGAKSGSTTLTVMCEKDDFDIKAAQQALGMKIRFLQNDSAKLNALLAAKTPPDIVRGSGATDAPYFAARNLMTDLDPYFAKSTALKPADLDPVNDLWRYDGSKQGAGPRYGMAKDFSQDQMFWYRTDMFEAAKLDLPSETEPLSFEEWLDLGKRLVKRRLGKVKVYGMNVTALGSFSPLMSMTASAGGSLFAEDLASVDFSSPEALKALRWYLDYTKADIGPSVVNPNPDGWDWPTFQAGRMAMAGDGYWFGGAIAGDPKVAEVSRLAPAPQLGSSRISPCFGATGFWMPKESKNKDAAWKFFEWYFGKEPALGRAAGGWGIPTLTPLRTKMPQDKPYQKQAFKVQEQELSHFSVLSFTPYAQRDALDGVISKVVPGAVKSGSSAGKVADELNKQMNDLLAQGKDVLG
ncbi:extracellular solute-binding protein [Streptomyces canus]|uniref:extracellular solute-binding protein n=1 Tax=Streptomyces canus TaxID=58343 RepID=UPI00074A85BC|nr:extracellular solute-binding protein [Streptomyces canus]KUN04492.1 ABC transporter substrate-binding protein [Streptomyces canus]